MPNWNTQNIGSSLSLPAHGRAGARATSSLAAHFAKRNTKFGGGGKARAGKKEGGWGEACLPAGREFLPALASCPVANAKRSASGVPPPPNFVFFASQKAPQKKVLPLPQPSHARATIRNSLISFD